MKFAAIIALLAFVLLRVAVAENCYNKKVLVKVKDGHDLNGEEDTEPDSYVTVKIGDKIHSTRVARSTCDPDWSERFTFDSVDSNIMKIEVWNENGDDDDDDDLLGTCEENMSTNELYNTHLECDIGEDGVVNMKYRCI
ncbi:perforin-1-like [Gouania willdenowi]|uniref:perforin-1-like n=1 Tax=Gouania willdenowi TaxID=441366 RepID=UPI001056DB68|nr:perforin-1-like [Gouania willdenowi]